MNRCCLDKLALFLLLGATVVPRRVRGHFFWAETNEEADRVTVTFSEQAGVPDKVVAMFEDRVTSMTYTYTYTGAAILPKTTVALAMNEEKTLLEGDLKPASPALLSGILDFGPFQNFEDLRYSFGAQIYNSEADFDGFFRPLLSNVGDTPTIVMRNCGGSSQNGTSYQFDVAGFPSEGGPLGVCMYRKGGLQVGCGTFSSGSAQNQEWHGETTSLDRLRRQLRSGDAADAAGGTQKMLHPTLLELVPLPSEQPHDESSSPYLLYALANKTAIDEASGKNTLLFASTSVYFQGPCQEEF